MSRTPFARGCVVARGRRFDVVLTDRGGADIDVVPLLQPRHAFRYDVPLSLADMVACGVAMADAVIRPKSGTVPALGYRQVGAVPGPVWCRIAFGLLRAAQERETLQRWGGERERHLDRRKLRPVNMAA